MNCLQLNWKYIQIINKCSNRDLRDFYDGIKDLPGAFTKKWYIWNLIRGKTFYINMAQFIVDAIRQIAKNVRESECPELFASENDTLEEMNQLIKDILNSEKDPEVRKFFIWNIGKHLPLLTVETVQYLNHDRIVSILTNGKDVIYDAQMKPLIDEIIALRAECDTLRSIVSDTQ